jgi:hypothetical protein
MDLIALLGLIYLVGLIVSPVLIRILPGLNEYLHENINTPNPAVLSTMVWPIMFVVLSLYHIFKLIVAIINWVSGNGFITKSNKDYREGGLQ